MILAAVWIFVPPDSTQNVKQFEDSIEAYMGVHRDAAKGLPPAKPTTESGNILSRQKELAEKIRAARAQAHQGDIFTQGVTQEFKRLIAIAMQGKNSVEIKKSLQRSEPVNLKLRVNDAYPSGIPLQSTPATLLLNFPRLPAQLEYRIVGHALVLRDSNANLIVDLIPDAIP